MKCGSFDTYGLLKLWSFDTYGLLKIWSYEVWSFEIWSFVPTPFSHIFTKTHADTAHTEIDNNSHSAEMDT